jgi:hypothetical protein
VPGFLRAGGGAPGGWRSGGGSEQPRAAPVRSGDCCSHTSHTNVCCEEQSRQRAGSCSSLRLRGGGGIAPSGRRYRPQAKGRGRAGPGSTRSSYTGGPQGSRPSWALPFSAACHGGADGATPPARGLTESTARPVQAPRAGWSTHSGRLALPPLPWRPPDEAACPSCVRRASDATVRRCHNPDA